MKIIILSLVVAVCLAEPPVDNRYLPPGAGGSQPSALYGAPGRGAQRQTEAVFGRQPARNGNGRRPSSQYGAPSQSNRYLPPSNSAPSSQYGAPNSAPSSTYGAPNSAPSSTYGAPNSAPSSTYGAPNSAPNSQYLPPSTQYGVPNQAAPVPGSQYGAPNAPSQEYGAPNALSQQYGAPSAPSQQYGAPGFGGDGYSQGGARGNGQGSRQYLPPGAGKGGYGGDDDGSNEPANYSFEYMVKDDESGNDFGHRESRMGDRAEGLYYVLLPDGRKQTVEYEADQEGYKPRISYEDTGAGLGGYDRNSQQGGYNGNGQGPY